jgi:hypothetical protein
MAHEERKVRFAAWALVAVMGAWGREVRATVATPPSIATFSVAAREFVGPVQFRLDGDAEGGWRLTRSAGTPGRARDVKVSSAQARILLRELWREALRAEIVTAACPKPVARLQVADASLRPRTFCADRGPDEAAARRLADLLGSFYK